MPTENAARVLGRNLVPIAAKHILFLSPCYLLFRTCRPPSRRFNALGGSEWHPHSCCHLFKSYSACVITFTMKTLWLASSTRVTSRYLLPPMLNTTQFPTKLDDANDALTSAHVCHEIDLLFTWVCHVRNGPSA